MRLNKGQCCQRQVKEVRGRSILSSLGKVHPLLWIVIMMTLPGYRSYDSRPSLSQERENNDDIYLDIAADSGLLLSQEGEDYDYITWI